MERRPQGKKKFNLFLNSEFSFYIYIFILFFPFILIVLYTYNMLHSVIFSR